METLPKKEDKLYWVLLDDELTQVVAESAVYAKFLENRLELSTARGATRFNYNTSINPPKMQNIVLGTRYSIMKPGLDRTVMVT